MNVEAENAVMRERARIREAVVKKVESTTPQLVNAKGQPFILMADVLAILSSNHGTI